MPRPTKIGLEFTFLSKDFFFDRKVRKLKRMCGDDAPYVFIALLCLITAEGYYIKYNNDVLMDLADMTGFGEERIADIIRACGEAELLDAGLMERELILTSHGIQQHYAKTCYNLKRKCNVDEYSLLGGRVSPEETGVSPEETGVSTEETAGINDNREFPPKKVEEMHTIEKNRREENRIEKKGIDNSSSSFVPSSPCVEELTPEQKEKERFIYYFTFSKNYPEPNKEYEKMVAYNSRAGIPKKWEKLTDVEKQSLLLLWEQKPVRRKRFGDSFLNVWQKLYENLVNNSAPYDVRMASLDDGVKWNENTSSSELQLTIPTILKEYMEGHMDDGIKTILWPFIRKRGCNKLMYFPYPK